MPELDLLRFCAFFMVFLSHVVPGDETFFAHAHLPRFVADVIIAMAAGGACGVDLFFVLSSFLITTLLLRERSQRGTITVGAFYVRRMLRIWPLYFLFLLIITPMVKPFLTTEDMPFKYTMAYSLLAGNWACAFWGYPHSVAGPLWSVSIEEQFYLSWPLIVQRWPAKLVAVAVTMLVLAGVSRIWLVAHGAVHPAIWCNTFSRLDPLACGALVAVWTQRNSVHLSTPVRLVLLVMGCVLIGLVGRYGDYVGTKALITSPVIATACTLLLIGTLDWQLPAERGWVIRAGLYLGSISYGLYVFHLLFVYLFGIGSAHTPIDRGGRIAAALAATIGVASLSYSCFERYFLRLKTQFSRLRETRG